MKSKQKICAIVAVGPDNVIGLNGVMPWHCKSDLYYFHKITISHPCIMGRVTFENLPTKPLPDRLNLVVSSHYHDEYIDGVFYAKSVESALEQCTRDGRIFICGGSQVYKYSLDNDLIDIMYLTVIKNSMLEQRIKQNPDVYCRFPVDTKVFLQSSKWVPHHVKYPLNKLPIDTNNTFPEFYKCIRVR